MHRSIGKLVIASMFAAGCGSAAQTAAAPAAATSLGNTAPAAGTPKAASNPNEDISRLDLGIYLKIAKLYCLLNLSEPELDFAGSQWLNDQGLVIQRSPGWTFGYYHSPSWSDPKKREYAALHINQRHAVSRGLPSDVSHRGVTPLYLAGFVSPKKAIAEALKQNLPKGDRYGVEYLSAKETEPALSAVTSFINGEPAGKIYIFAAAGKPKK